MTITPSELGDLFREHGELRHVNLGTEDEPIESCERPQHIEGMAEVVGRAGGRFTCEELTTGEVSVACEYNDRDIAIEVCANGPPVPGAVDRIVKLAFKYITGLEPTPGQNECTCRPDDICFCGKRKA